MVGLVLHRQTPAIPPGSLKRCHVTDKRSEAMVGDLPTTCDDCGACCMHMNLVPLSGWCFDSDSPLSAEEENQLQDVLHGMCGGDDETPCIWLDRLTGRCKHYEKRPPVCREFEVGSEACLLHRDRRKWEVSREQ